MKITALTVGPVETNCYLVSDGDGVTAILDPGAEPEKIRCLAETAFAGTYPPDVIGRWFALFVRRFFRQQFKRSCVPDGPKVGTIALSPRGDWRMPSDACVSVWQAELDTLT